MPKFKVGQLVECIDAGDKGCGWMRGHRFIITRIGEVFGVYFGGIEGNGVFENSLVPVKKNVLKHRIKVEI